MAVVSRAIFADILPTEKLTKLGVLMGSMFGLGPVIGPLIGGYLQFYYGWKSCFVFFTGIMLLEAIIIFKVVPETCSNHHPLNIKTIKSNVFEVISHRRFMALVFIMGSTYSLIIAFNTLGPFLIQEQLHYSPIFFGHLALYMGISFLLATFLCRYLLKTHQVKQLLRFFISTFFIIAIITVTLSYILYKNIFLCKLCQVFDPLLYSEIDPPKD